MINYPFFYIRCEHSSDVTMNYDLLVRAEDEADALALWREYYGEALDDGDHDEPGVRLLEVPDGRGAISWS